MQIIDNMNSLQEHLQKQASTKSNNSFGFDWMWNELY